MPSAPRPAPTTSDRRALRRQELLDVAVGVIRDEGPDASMDRIASACGVTKPIIYRHFGDRAGLIEAIGLQFVSGLAMLGRETGGVAFWAHVGGFAAGVVLVRVFARSEYVAAHRARHWRPQRVMWS